MKILSIKSPLGNITAIADEDGLFLLDFEDRKDLFKRIHSLEKDLGHSLSSERNAILESLEGELFQYFDGTLKTFKTPIHIKGTPFQQKAWNALLKIPYGETKGYQSQAISIGNPKSYRAVANANGANRLSIIIPCHRIINTNGHLGGYGGGTTRKQWLLTHEQKFA